MLFWTILRLFSKSVFLESVFDKNSNEALKFKHKSKLKDMRKFLDYKYFKDNYNFIKIII